MFFETIIIPFILGLVTNKVSNEIFRQEGLYEIVEELYYKSADEFNAKYQGKYGGTYDNFLTRRETVELIMKSVLNFNDISEVEFENTSDFFGQPTPQEVVKDFVYIFNEKLNEDKRLAIYRNVREHQILTENILNEIKQLKQIRFKKFISSNEFFNFNTEGDINAIKKLDCDVERVISALNDFNIILIDSFRGFGKTETLKKISISESIGSLFDNVIIMRHGVRNIIDALQTELIQEKKYLIIVDNSELCMDEIKELLNFMKSIGVLSKIIMSVQTYSTEAIKTLISSSGLIKDLGQISLNNWEKEDYIELLRVSAQVTEFIDEDIIVAMYPSPTLIKWIGEKRKSNVEDLLTEYKELLENDAYAILNDYMPREDCDRLIFSLCCSVPFVLSNEQCELINESIHKSYDIKVIVLLLQKGGVLRKVGHLYRFYPDIKGDVFFAYSLNDKYDSDILDYWIKHDQGRVLQNIRDASLVSVMNIQDKLKLLIDEWSRSKGYFEQSKNLEIASYIASFSPETVTNLVYCYLDDTKNSDGESYWRLTTDKFGPVLLELWKFSNDIESLLYLLCELETYKLDGTYDNYKVKGLTKGFFSPIKNRPERIINSLNILQSWIDRDKAESLTIFKYAASEILRGSHQVTKSIINGIQFSQRTVKLNKEIIDMRDKCIEVMENLINSRHECKIFEIIESICYEIGNQSFSDENSPLSQVFISERKRLVDILGSKLLLSCDISTNIIIERILMHWWAGQYPGFESAEIYLLQFKRDSRYLFAKYYVDVDYRVISFDELVAIAPSEERWSWFVDEVMYNTNETGDDSRRIAVMLYNEIKSIEALSEFLKCESQIISNFKLAWSTPKIIDNWADYNNDLFVEFIHSGHYFNIIGFLKAPILEAVITHSSTNQKKEIISSFLGTEAKLSDEEIFTLLHIAEDDALDEVYVLMMINSIIDVYYFEYAGGFIHRLYFIFKNRNRGNLINILLKIIRKYPFNESIINMIDFIIQQFIKDLEVVNGFQELKDEILQRICSFKKMDYHEYKIVGVLLRNKEEALEFIKNRFINEDISKLDKVPYGGFPFLTEYIANVESFRFLTCELMKFMDHDLITEYDLSCIIKPLFLVRAKADEVLGTSLLKCFINEKAIRSVFVLMNCFILSEEAVNDFVDALKYLNDNAKGKEAEDFIYSQRFPEEGWSRSTGQDSPELTNRVSLYSEIHKLLPFGRLKLAAERCIDYLRKEMEEDIIRDEEVLNPR